MDMVGAQRTKNVGSDYSHAGEATKTSCNCRKDQGNFNKNTTIIKSSIQDQKVKFLITFCLSLPVTNNWTLILACFNFSCMIHANSSIELKHLI